MKKLITCLMILFAMTSVMAQKITNAGTYAKRFDGFVSQVAKHDTLSVKEKAKVDSTYQAYLSEYSIVKDSLSDEDVRKCSKAKVRYQKEMARIFVNKTSGQVADTAEDVGDKVSKAFKRTKKKIQGAFEALKND